jgi:VanZ family protein
MNNSVDSIDLAAPLTAHGKRRLWLWWGLALVWMGGIFFFSAQTNFDFAPEQWQIDPVSWAAHFAEYAVLAALLWQALRHTPRLGRRAVALAFVLAALYAISDEWHQSFVPGRYPDIRDVLVDVAGALTALLLLGRKA